MIKICSYWNTFLSGLSLSIRCYECDNCQTDKKIDSNCVACGKAIIHIRMKKKNIEEFNLHCLKSWKQCQAWKKSLERQSNKTIKIKPSCCESDLCNSSAADKIIFSFGTIPVVLLGIKTLLLWESFSNFLLTIRFMKLIKCLTKFFIVFLIVFYISILL